MRKLSLVFSALMLIAFYSCQNASEPTGQLQSADSLVKQWDDAWNSASKEKVMALLTTDATLFMDTVYSGQSLEMDFVIPSVAILRNLKTVKVVENIDTEMVSISGSYIHDWTRNDTIVGSQKGYFSLLWKLQPDHTWKISTMHIH